MPTLYQQAAFAQDQAVREAIAAAIVSAAVSIHNEPSDTPNHEQRVELAHAVIAAPASMAVRFAWAMSGNATVVDKYVASDLDGMAGDFAYVVSTVWDAVAASIR